ncbi:hypothetical protein GCM10010833_22780 [Blastomonas aquatica]|uniref:Uncharacterized protein n=1 Tax=Blastomonas aquatica TaxID=1510276 RepID=A0ABQ1JEN2_9SPHN|nr:hypothetical protein GCM10010833_22780 [Blastomonas aquatica]
MGGVVFCDMDALSLAWAVDERTSAAQIAVDTTAGGIARWMDRGRRMDMAESPVLQLVP